MKRNKVKFITPINMVRKATNMLLRVTSKNNERFSSPVIFKTFSDAAKALGFTEQGIGKAYRSNNNKKRSHTQLDSRKQVIAFQDRMMTINIKDAQHPLKREKSNRQIQYNVENFDKIHASSASVRNWSSQ